MRTTCKHFRIQVIIILFSVSFLLGSCSNNEPLDVKAELAKYEWMVGRWNSSSDPAVWEIWESDSTELTGLSFQIVGMDSTILERMKIKWVDTTFVFIADVPQNPDLVEFVLTKKEANRLQFENPNHDFPKEIMYQKVGNNSLVAEVGDGSKTIKFLFVRR